MFISVALCTYNGQQFLQQQLQSIFSQTTKVDEVVICDEGSVDDTIAIINSFKQTFPAIIQLSINEQKLGVVKNFEKAIRITKGNIIFFCDQDDVWQNNKVEECVKYLNTHSAYSAVFTNADLINDKMEALGTTMWDIIQFKDIADNTPGLNIEKHLIFHGNVVTGACLAIKKEALQTILPFKEVGDLYHDEYIALKLAEKGKIGFLNKSLIKYRLHGNQQSKVIRHQSRTAVNEIKKAVLKGNINSNPLEYYRYWKRRMKAIDLLKANDINIKEEFIKEIKSERKKGLIAYYKSFNFFKRKKALFHDMLKGHESISLNDVLVG